MSQIKGEFKVELTPLETNLHCEGGMQSGRMAISKVFSGELSATSKGEMLSCMTAQKGSAGYVAIEQVSGTLEGKQGSFVLQHFGLMDKGNQRQLLEVIPDSGTGELKNLKGQMRIEITNGKHFYQFNYTL